MEKEFALKKFIGMVALIILALSVSHLSYAALYGKRLCKEEGFHCIKVKKNQSWESLFPDANQRDIVMRINRMNINLWRDITIAVPDNLEEADIMDFSPFPAQIEAPDEKLVVVDPIEQAWGAYDADGTLIRWGPASSGRDWCKDIGDECRTSSGTYRVYSMGSSNCVSKKFPLPNGGAPMPFCMFFHRGEALHGEPQGLPGYNNSHGCVRLYVNDVAWLRFDFIDPPMSDNEYRGTKIIITPYPPSKYANNEAGRDGDFYIDDRYFSST